MKTRLPLTLTAILLIASFGFAQQRNPTSQPSNSPASKRPAKVPQESADDDVVRITTKLVQMDAVVTDRNGKLVTDLRPDEVQIFEDGKRQAVTHLSYFVTGSRKTVASTAPLRKVDNAAAPVPPVTLKREDVRRTMALVVDDLGLSFESIHFVKEALKKFVDEQMQPGDLVAIIRTGGGVGALQQFTADKRILYAAIERVKWHPMSRGGITAVPRIEARPNLGLPGNLEDEVNAFLTNAGHVRTDALEVGTLGALRQVVSGLGEVPGRKSVLLISDGIRVSYSGDRDSSYRVLQGLQQLAELANRSSVVIYTMDPRGLKPLTISAADDLQLKGNIRTPIQIQQAKLVDSRTNDFHEGQNGLNLLADETGGIFVHNDNDLNHGMQGIIEDQEGYYLVGYRPDESTFDAGTGRRKFHSLTLKVTRPGKFNVRMRKGFYGITDEEAKAERNSPQQQVSHALTSPFGANGVHVRLTSAYSNDPQQGSLLSSMLHIDGSDLTFTDAPGGWHKAEFDVVAITYGDNGRIIDQVGKTHSISVRGDSYQSVLKEGFVYIVEVPVKKPGAYQLRVALRDHGSERVGSASQFVEVPDLTKGQLTLSSVLVSGVDPAKLRKVNANHTSAGEREVNDPRNAAAVRQFRQGTIMQYGLAMYNAHLDKATGQPRIRIRVRILRDGQPVFTGQDDAFELKNQTDVTRLSVGGAIQLGSQLTPGEYVFQVIVTDLLADSKHRLAAQWIDFEIVK